MLNNAKSLSKWVLQQIFSENAIWEEANDSQGKIYNPSIKLNKNVFTITFDNIHYIYFVQNTFFGFTIMNKMKVNEEFIFCNSATEVFTNLITLLEEHFNVTIAASSDIIQKATSIFGMKIRSINKKFFTDFLAKKPEIGDKLIFKNGMEYQVSEIVNPIQYTFVQKGESYGFAVWYANKKAQFSHPNKKPSVRERFFTDSITIVPIH